MTPLVPLVLFAAAASALALGVATHRKSRAAGVETFGWMMAAVAGWCVTSAMHGLADSLAHKVIWAKVQYVPICLVPPLWLLFTAEYAGVDWRITVKTGAGAADARTSRDWLRAAAFWLIPASTVLLAATNEWHRAVWPSIRIEPSGFTTYTHGWWFWVAAVYNYAALFTGTVLLVRTARRSPPLFRGQLVALIAAALVPWISNLAYVAGWTMPGLDPTPLAFTVSGMFCVWGLYSNHLFDLVPVARDKVVDSLSDAVIVLDPRRRILDLNRAARTLVPAGLNWLGRPLDAVLPVLEGTVLETSFGPPATIVMCDEAGRPRDWDVRVVPVRHHNRRLAAWAVLLRDVTEQRQAAAERDAFQARAQEQQRRESLSVLAGGLAHDFNNLLAGIVGNADLLSLQVAKSPEMSHHVGAILLGAQRAADLVSKMLAYAGERHGTVERVDLDALVRELLDLLQASAGRHCRIDYRGEPVLIQGDPTQLRQVAMNLIINAAEAVDEGTGVVMVKVGTAMLSTGQLADMKFGEDAAPGRYVYLEVRDNGHGMNEETLRRIFNPFFTTKASGHGLGLAAVQGIVMGHRGALRVDSRPGIGTRFDVWFPAAQATVTALPSSAPAAASVA